MRKKNLKVVFGVTIIISAIIYLGVTGIQQDFSYYLNADEFIAKVNEMDEQAYQQKFRVRGQVVEGSIDRVTRPMEFKITHNNITIPVQFVGSSPVPDTFKDLSHAVVDGKYTPEGLFLADKIQAKCASKYEAMVEEVSVKK
ncbi:cytochrome c maturation protein CcmE [candidate division KSB1 bacterium]